MYSLQSINADAQCEPTFNTRKNQVVKVSPGGSLGARVLVCTRSFSEYFFMLESNLGTGTEGVRVQGQFFVPHCFSVQKVQTSSIMTCSAEVSPPPESTISPASAFTEQQKAFIGPHHLSKILGQKPPINH